MLVMWSGLAMSVSSSDTSYHGFSTVVFRGLVLERFNRLLFCSSLFPFFLSFCFFHVLKFFLSFLFLPVYLLICLSFYLFSCIFLHLYFSLSLSAFLFGVSLPGWLSFYIFQTNYKNLFNCLSFLFLFSAFNFLFSLSLSFAHSLVWTFLKLAWKDNR